MPVRFTLSPLNAPRTVARTAAALLTVALISACSTDQPAPTGPNASLDASSRNGVPFITEAGLVSPVWQATARSLVSAAAFSPLAAIHAYPLLGVAQYQAVQLADAATGNGDGGRRRLEAERGAVAGASIATLSYLFPTHVQDFENLRAAQANAGPGQPHPGFAEGEAIGRAVGAAIVTRAISDGYSVVANPAPPVGPGFWTTNAVGLPVAGGQFAGITPWFLTSASQFRPGAPPAFGSTDLISPRSDTSRTLARRSRPRSPRSGL